MANLTRGGFRWRFNRLAPTSTSPPITVMAVASAYGTAIRKGDPVKLVATGTIEVATPGDRVIGVADGVDQYWDGTVIRKGDYLPASTTYGSNISRQSLVRVIAPRGQVFEIDADDAVTFTTLAGYQSAIGENAEWAAGTAVGGQSGAVLDISGHAVTATLSVRIVDVPSPSFQDFASTGVKLHVEWNLTQGVSPGQALGT